MRRCALFVSLALFLFSLSKNASAQPRPGRGIRVDGVAAYVGGATPGPNTTVILLSDVSLRARIALSRSSTAVPTGSLPEDLLARTLDELIAHALIANEADRLRAEAPSDRAVAEELAALGERAGGASRLNALARAIGADADELREIAHRRAYVRGFLDANLEGATVISDAQVARVYESDPHPFRGRPLEVVREPLRAWISEQVIARDVSRYIEVLRSRSPVRIFASWRASQRPVAATEATSDE